VLPNLGTSTAFKAKVDSSEHHGQSGCRQLLPADLEKKEEKKLLFLVDFCEFV
jgi:hypothetical protein